jgi:REP element-mobilizing transposase RayT
LHLKRDEIAQIVIDSLFRGVGLRQYDLGAFALMANHVHVLLRPLIPPDKLLKTLKGVTAREANRALGRTGEPFWQRESYDHWVRNSGEFQRIVRYIEMNPIKAGLALSIEAYRWCSAWPEFANRVHMSVNAARRSACATSLRILA